MSRLGFVTLTYPMTGEFKVDTNMKANYVTDVIEAYIQQVMGAGKDPNPANAWEVYEITLQIEFDDSITVTHNYGNLGLVAGILLVILRRLHEDT